MRAPLTFAWRNVVFGSDRDDAWALYRMLRAIATYVGKQVFAEDASIYEGVQRGLEASPHRGVIGTREERIHVFQKYVLDRTRGATELPQVPVGANGHG